MDTGIRPPVLKETAEQTALYRLLIPLAAALDAETKDRGHRAAMKGGTALKLTLGLTRPSTDIDFDTSFPDRMALSVVRGAVARRNERWQSARVWQRLVTRLARPGNTRVEVKDTKTGTSLRTRVECRQFGTMPGNERGYRPHEIIRVEGIDIYDRRALIDRKLGAIIGPSPRSKARDVYDLVWLRAVHRNAITPKQLDAMTQWRERMRRNNPTTRDLAREFNRDTTMNGTSLDELIRCFDSIVAKERSLGAERRRNRTVGKPTYRGKPPRDDS